MYALTTFFAGVFLLLSSCAGPMDQGDLGTDISNQEEAAESEAAESEAAESEAAESEVAEEEVAEEEAAEEEAAEGDSKAP